MHGHGRCYHRHARWLQAPRSAGVAYARLRRSTRPSVQWVGQTQLAHHSPHGPGPTNTSRFPECEARLSAVALPSRAHITQCTRIAINLPAQSACKLQAWLLLPQKPGSPLSVSTTVPEVPILIFNHPSFIARSGKCQGDRLAWTPISRLASWTTAVLGFGGIDPANLMSMP